MKKILYLSLAILTLTCSNIQAAEDSVIRMIGREENGYSEPKYLAGESVYHYDWKDRYNIELTANPDMFPWSSRRQGSVFEKIFRDLAEKEHIVITQQYPQRKSYEESVDLFEKGDGSIKGLFTTYYENIPYSKNQYIYPAFFENNVHVITSAKKTLNLKTKEELKNYKGIYVEQDYFSSFVLKDFANLGITKVKDFPEAYKKLLTGEVDYVVGSYYPSQIELYKLGIHDYVAYSKTPIWKMPMFMRVKPEIASHPRVSDLKKYLKSASYAKVKEEGFQELLNIYKESTKGIVPPTYINTSQPEETALETSEEKAQEQPRK